MVDFHLSHEPLWHINNPFGKNYRNFVVHTTDLEQELDELDMLEQVEFLDNEFAIESIKAIEGKNHNDCEVCQSNAEYL